MPDSQHSNTTSNFSMILTHGTTTAGKQRHCLRAPAMRGVPASTTQLLNTIS